ncbi:MAG: 6-carboxytetrahydropterin synthase QueD [Candidatus Schekmanbacteria bacterium RIFCSPHIGHO2_02_FULL_38_11]|uniref:6-carboxy-5,6,7,8-tetrahydropterin synthase n=1 Tax=Candidatus Schekmanbacteria bacterium RIFCSPLOWO2_12_FULL_38_15 TaxID=1817883 RepID=A0A1F7SNG0_9BACT|nr:MAG: 6-carboxytetrahydropterin synthase QueD [Candidatus Schekmanbacteria bacterium GWA2_38_9]OGL48833.1 MAG: 6-carboxytetrahydropterin synthase QueD [Candidatus Schekmanbacteria bacterium RIFCSPLOWO2_02_FULL_38_14]OGL49777.1 MAG: 6-carboxytetrahydropterin synthase QueD [Candidatus Schekmanbacteria bacterium RIFCSPHIGHO2_02_FULL_38_11]OGL55330.1 MAG: 6-carboxytetrahydropterin synthase QueD [Candidatus Schekmanbacteria bacterium RIFCSPLOWO2_12_FULL_38_15]
MFELMITSGFSAAHQLKEYGGKCEALHGHNWKVEVYVKSSVLDKTGMVMDFAEIKKAANLILAELDHKNLNEIQPFRDKNPTAENISLWVFNQLCGKMNSDNIKVSKVRVWETETSCASYSEES